MINMEDKGLLSKLPPPPVNKGGWPWTVESDPNLYRKGVDYPKISIVTPSFNQASFIE